VAVLEGQLIITEEKLENERKSIHEKLKLAKDSWKEQAIEYGRKQREQAYEECDQTVKTFRELFLAESSNKTNSLVSSLVRSKFNEQINITQSNIFGAIAHSTTADDHLIICDFDVTDCHIAIRNRSHGDVSISNYTIRFLHAGHSFKFPDGVVVHSNSLVSLWWGPRNQLRSAHQAGSFVWPTDAHVTADHHEIAELVDRHNRVVFSISTNQDTELMMNGSIPHTTASEKRSKRKRDEVASSLISPAHKKAAVARHDQSLASSSVEVINLEDMNPRAQEPHSNEVNDLIYNMNWESIFLMPTPKPSLYHRMAGPISIVSVEMVPKAMQSGRPTENGELMTWTPSRTLNARYDLKDMHITLMNDSREALPLTDWRLLVIGYPTTTFEIPPGTIIPGKRSIVFTSNEHEAEEFGSSDATDLEESLSDDVSVGGTRRRRTREHHPAAGRPSVTTRHSSRAIRENNSLITRSGALYVHTNSSDTLEAAGEDHEHRFDPRHGPATPSIPSQVVVIHELSNIAKYFPFPRSIHLLDVNGQNVCELVESGDLAGIFTSMKHHHPSLPIGNRKSMDENDTTTRTAAPSRGSCAIQ
jgi:hypothetical protein